MRINPVSIISQKYYFNSAKENSNKNNFAESSVISKPITMSSGVYGKALVNFTGYYGDQQPAKKLFWILTGRNAIYEDAETNNNLYPHCGWRKWVQTRPEDLLKRTPEQAIQSICTIIKPANQYPGIPDYIPTPNYGDKWGRRANYIEINPRTLALTQGSKKTEGLLNIMKILPAIPPSGKSIANCIILSQLYPTQYKNGDGYTGYSSLYSADLHSGISKNLTSENLTRDGQRMGEDEQVKAFNDMAHLRGLKTGIRMPLSEGQLSVQGRPFNWYNDEKAFIDACCWAIDLGFDAIFFDSAKHVGNYDMGNYCGVGTLPNYRQMQYITQQIREKTGRNDIAFIGEKANNDERFNYMGLSAGTDWGKADSFDSVMHEYDKQRWNDEYAAGPIITDDNDNGSVFLYTRLNRIKQALHAYREIGYKLPVFMQLADIFPLSPYDNTHDLMMNGYNKTAYGDLESHYNNTFNTSNHAKNYTLSVYKEFADVMYQ